MKSQTIGPSDLVSSVLSYGCMRIAGTWNPAEITPDREEKGRAALLAAYEAGYTLFDHADIYCAGGCETIHGRLMKDVPEMRRNILIATKCGIRFPHDPLPHSPHRYDFSAEHILWSCDQSLARLQTDFIDIYQLHRPDFLMNPAEVATAFTKLHEAGKVRWFGVSNFSPSFVRALQAHLPFPIVVNQVEIHLGRLAPFADGTLDQCLELGVTPLSWSPLAGGWLGDGAELPSFDARQPILDALDEFAREAGVSRTVAALAWLRQHPSGIIPIVGSVNPERIQDAVTAAGLEMGREWWYRILVTARGEGLP